jgi:hypothetical protein
MTKYEKAIKLSADEMTTEHGGLDAAIQVVSADVAHSRTGSKVEYPVAMRRFYACVLAQLRTDRANGRL